MERVERDWTPFPVDGSLFTPAVYLDRVDLPDFGCEGRPDGDAALGAVWGQRPDGFYFWRVPEWELLSGGFADDQWLGERAGEWVLVTLSGQWKPVHAGEALEQFLHTSGIELP